MPRPPAHQQSLFRSVAMPTEHGGWGLTIEPGLLGLLVAPSWAGLFIAIAAVLAFLARTPIKLALVDRRRGRSLERTKLATKLGLAESIVIIVLVAAAAVLANVDYWWLPAIAAAPLMAIEGWYDVRSRGRRLTPELAGAVAIASVAAMVALLGGASTALALGLWTILAARVLTSIPHIRAQIGRMHGRPPSKTITIIGDLAAIAVAGAAALADNGLILGAIAILLVVAGQRVIDTQPPRPPKVLGMMHMIVGFAIVVVTSIGTAIA